MTHALRPCPGRLPTNRIVDPFIDEAEGKTRAQKDKARRVNAHEVLGRSSFVAAE